MTMELPPQPRVLLAGAAARPEGELRRFLVENECEWEFVEKSDALVDALERDGFDLLVLDAALPEVDPGVLKGQLLNQGSKLAAVLVLREGQGHRFEILEDLPFFQYMGCLDLQKLREFLESRDRGMNPAACERMEETLTISARDAEGGLPAMPLLDRLCRVGLVDSAMKHRLVLAYQEAFTNSLDHGSLELSSVWKEEFDEEGRDLYARRRRERLGSDRFGDRAITISAEYDTGKYTLRIRDEGPGFSLNRAHSLIHENGAMSFHGRGLAIIGSIMDEVGFNDEGTEIVLVKYLGC